MTIGMMEWYLPVRWYATVGISPDLFGIQRVRLTLFCSAKLQNV